MYQTKMGQLLLGYVCLLSVYAARLNKKIN